jgi:hypothetical protein
LGAYFSINEFSKNMVPQVPLEINVRNMALSENNPAGTLFVTAISRGTWGNP